MSEETKPVEETTVEIAEVTKPEPTSFATDGLLPQEVEMAEKHGLVEKEVDESSKEEKKEEKTDGEHEEQSESETDKDSGKKEDEGEEKKVEEKSPTFDDVEKNEDNLKKYNPNEQALYWKYKSDKRKRQKAQKDYEELKAEYELSSVKDKSKVNKISEALKGEGITVEALQAIIGEATEGGEALTKAEYKKLESAKTEKAKDTQEENQFRTERLKTAEEIGKTKYGNFEELTILAQEVVNSDSTDTYKSVLNAAFSDKDLDEEQLVERVVTIARLSPNYGKKKEEVKSEEKKPETDADRAIKNSKKKISSAAVGSGSSSRTISHDDLTVDDAAKLSASQWMKLPADAKKRLLME